MRAKLIDLLVLVVITLIVMSWWIILESRSNQHHLNDLSIYYDDELNITQYVSSRHVDGLVENRRKDNL